MEKASGATAVVEESRRRFIERARAAAAVPVIVALSMAWSSEARATV
jgi:hypothetical protein